MNASHTEIDTLTRVEVIHRLLEKVRACYIFPEVGEKICERLQKRLDDGDYEGISEGDFFAYALTTHLQEVNHDEHLWVRWHAQPLPEHDGQLRQNPAWQAEREMEARLDNYGLHRLERLPGNVGYLEVRYFHRPEWGGASVTAAMVFLAHTNALILDLRGCLGGFPGMVAQVCGCLFSQPVPLARIEWHDDGTTQEFCANPEGTPQPLAEVPVYVLTSQRTFSAGEMCAAVLQSRKRAVVVGEKTDGGAHPGASYRLHAHFEAFIPIGRVTDPVTGGDWEGVGVTPDIAIPQQHALQAAYNMALKAILANLGNSPGGPHKALANEAQEALRELEESRKICPACGYSNPLYRARCKNCGEPVSG